MLSPHVIRQLRRIVPFGVIWLLGSQIFLLSDFAAVGNLEQVPDTAIRLDLGIYLFATVTVTVLGLGVGALEGLFLNRRLAALSFAQTIAVKLAFYAVLFFVVVTVTFPIAASMELGTMPWDAQVWDKYTAFLGSPTHLGTGIQLSTLLGTSLFYAEISDHMGPEVLTNFLTGTYHRPREETRIFMFSDMKSSTQIAEALGHIAYFELLQAYYRDLSDAIITHGGEIYQYVGDEVIVSWRTDHTGPPDQCVRCFQAMKTDLAQKAAWYQDRFGVVPDFKAGMHLGPVTAGEIGALKKEIVFTGDVLNATARLQALCTTHQVDLLLSADLVAHLGTAPPVSVRSLGAHALRGRAHEMELFTLA
ncbi:MAG: adenylate/guanylate cyclase domain-containing protein [Bacteroidota bacterium]